MMLNARRREFAFEFLELLTAKGIPYAIQRNLDEIFSGTFKDIDLIAPKRSFRFILQELKCLKGVFVISVLHGFSRSQIIVKLSGPKSIRVPIDIDYQVTLAEDGIGSGWIGQLSARSMTFFDLQTCSLAENGVGITQLDPASELILLKNHARNKPKEKYHSRITKLEIESDSKRGQTQAFSSRGINLLRRYVMILLSLPCWIGSHMLQRWCYSSKRGNRHRHKS